jgi:hypothetical protein
VESIKNEHKQNIIRNANLSPVRQKIIFTDTTETTVPLSVWFKHCSDLTTV